MKTTIHQKKQIIRFIDNYEDLRGNVVYLKIIAEFVAHYRFLTLKAPADHALHQFYYKVFYETHIEPLLKNIDDNDRSTIINEIIQKMIELPTHNDHWAVMFIVEVYRSPFSWPPHRHLLEEIATHNFRQTNTTKENYFKNRRAFFIDASSRGQYIKSHIPEHYAAFRRLKYIPLELACFESMLIFYASSKNTWSENIKYAAILIPFSFIVLAVINFFLAMLINQFLPSRLCFAGLPRNIGHGLLDEIGEHIKKQIDFYTAQLPPKRKNFPENKATAATPILRAITLPDTTPVNLSSRTDSNPLEALEAKKDKLKRRSPQPNLLALVHPIFNSAPIHRWKTKEFGLVTFQPNRASDNIVALWSTDKKYNGRYAVFLPHKFLEQKEERKGLTAAFWETASWGRVVRRDQSGYVPGPHPELGPEAKFKVKTHRDEYSDYRQPIVPCELAAEDDEDEHTMELLLALPPVKTH